MSVTVWVSQTRVSEEHPLPKSIEGAPQVPGHFKRSRHYEHLITPLQRILCGLQFTLRLCTGVTEREWKLMCMVCVCVFVCGVCVCVVL